MKRFPGFRVERVDSRPEAGSKDVWFGLVNAVVKTQPESQTLVPVEFICSRLAVALGLPVPVGDAADFQGQQAWVSAQVTLDGVILPPADPEEVAIAAGKELAGVFVFDVWVHNCDRHEDNILHHPGVGFWAIDHEDALGGEGALDPDRLRRQVDHATNWHLDVTLDDEAVSEWVGAVRNLPQRTIRAALDEAWARRLVTRKQQAGLLSFLSDRQKNLGQLVDRSRKSKGRGIEEASWRLPPSPTSLFSSPLTSDDESPGTSG